MIRIDLKKIKSKFVDLQSDVRESLRNKPLNNIVEHILGYVEVFEHNGSDILVHTFSEETLRSLSSTDELFRVLQKRWNFLENDLLISIVKRYGDEEIKSKIDNYSKDLREFLENRKLSEVSQTRSLQLSSSDDITSEPVLMKFNLSDPTLQKILDLKSKICEILGINPSSLRICDIKEGCIQITFLIPVQISEFVFCRPFSHEQQKALQEASVIKLIWRDEPFIMIVSN